jgi:hypothetical protein
MTPLCRGADRPSRAQQEAVAEAARRVEAAFGPLPAFRVTWARGPMRSLATGEPINACVFLDPVGESLIALSLLASPSALLRSAVHELVHVVHRHLNPHATRAELESAAERVTANLVDVGRAIA